MRKTLLIYGLSLGVIAFFLKITEYWFWIKLNAYDVYLIIIATTFLATGLWLGWRMQLKNKPQSSIETPVTEQNTEGVDVFDIKQIEKLGISKREHEVLVLMGKGMSNQEIADSLFVSQSTIKTHTSRLFEKLDVKNRTHAILKAKELGILHLDQNTL